MENYNKKINRKITYVKLVELFHICLEEVKNAGIEYGNIKEPLIINTRAKTFYGRCIYKKERQRHYYEIEVTTKLLYAEESKIKATLIHEILHTCDGCMNHGNKWLNYANIMNKKYGYNIKEKTSHKEKGLDDEVLQNTYKYCVECKSCHHKVYKSRMCNLIKYPENYRCSCGGMLEVVKN